MTARGNDEFDFDVVISGAWTRTRVAECLTKAAADPRVGALVEQTGRYTVITSDGASVILAWADERTLVFSTRERADAAWLEARLDGRDSVSDNEAMAGMLSQVNRKTTAWFAGDPGGLLDDPLVKDAPRESALFGDVTVDAAFDFTLGFRYETEADAKAAVIEVQKEVSEMSENDPAMEALLGKFEVERQKREVIVRGHLTSFATSLLGASLLGYFESSQ